MNNSSKVLSILAGHIGKGNGLSVKQLAGETGIHERTLRQVVSELREEGHAICGKPCDGYYIAETAAELEETCRFIRSRSMHGLRMESRMCKIPLPDLIGQLHLPT